MDTWYNYTVYIYWYMVFYIDRTDYLGINTCIANVNTMDIICFDYGYTSKKKLINGQHFESYQYGNIFELIIFNIK